MLTQLQTSVSNAAEVSLHWRAFFITLSRCLAGKTASEAFVWSACCSVDSMGQNVTKMDEGEKYELKSKRKAYLYLRLKFISGDLLLWTEMKTGGTQNVPYSNPSNHIENYTNVTTSDIVSAKAFFTCQSTTAH